ncbi:hypothetical protein FJT64_023562 [Amphibalanus amphitrite]|uniref:Uncharacterized protein n=1 Tax=Amphibalanus amphitrite TaxID=1232801 RepID=A0A6A4WPZ4_AMPAM|nr:hypothetical protein FJT64_023562 [Amphibalanus amphitrite]
MDIIWATDEQKLIKYLQKLRESANRLKKRFTLVKTPSFMAAADPEPHIDRGVSSSRGGGECTASGTGLLRAERGRVAEFSVFFPRTSQPDLLLELRSETGDFFTQRVTERSPPRVALADSLRTVSGIGLLRTIPVGYRVTGKAVMVSYRPPTEGQLEVSVVWRGHHVPGSPFTLLVKPGEPDGEEVSQPEVNIVLYSDLYADFETPRESRYRLHAEQSRSKVYLGPVLARARPADLRTSSRRISPTSFSMEEAKRMLLDGGRTRVKRQVEPSLEIRTEGHVVRMREMFERFIELERSAGGRPTGLQSSRSLASLPGSESFGAPWPLDGVGRSHSTAALWRPVEIHTLEQQALGSRAMSEPAHQPEEEDQPERRGVGPAPEGVERPVTAPLRVRDSPRRSLSCSVAEPMVTGPADINRAQFEAILRYFEGLRDGRILDGAPAPAPARAPRSQAALGWLRRRWPSSGAPGGRFDLRRAGLRRSLGALPPPLSPPIGEGDDDGLADAESVVLAPAPVEGPPLTVPRVMAEYPYLSKRRSRPRLAARGLIPHQELVRRARDRVVAFGPGLFHGHVGTDNTFQLYVPEPQCAPRRVTVHPASAPSSAATLAECELRYLGYMYHEVRYRVCEAGWYRVRVTLGAHAADVDVLVRVTSRHSDVTLRQSWPQGRQENDQTSLHSE